MRMTNRWNPSSIFFPLYFFSFLAVLNLGAKLLGTDINRRLGEIVAGTQFTVLLNEPSLLNGMYRIIIIQSPAGH